MEDAPGANVGAEDAAKENTTEAEATANDASLSAKAPETSAETEKAAGKAAYEDLARALDAGNAERAVVQVQQQPKRPEASPKPTVAATTTTIHPPGSASAMAAIPVCDPHLLIKTADKMAISADQFAANAKSNAPLMKGTAQVHFHLSFYFLRIYPTVAPER